MLRSRPANDGDILTAPQSASGRWGAPSTEAEEGLERRHRGSPTIMAEHKLVEVHLQLRAADAVVRADQPLLQVADRAVGSGTTDGTPPRRAVRLGCFFGTWR